MSPISRTISWQMHETPSVLYSIYMPAWHPFTVLLSISTILFASAQLFYAVDTTKDLVILWWFIGLLWLWIASPLMVYATSKFVYKTDLWQYRMTDRELIATIDNASVRHDLVDLRVTRDDGRIVILRPKSPKRRSRGVGLYFEDMGLKAKVIERVKEANGD